MATLRGSGWTSHTLGTLNHGIAALGRRSLEDALGVYGGFEGLAEALAAVNDGEFQAAADELNNEVSTTPGEDGECPPGYHLEGEGDQQECVPDEEEAIDNSKRENKQTVIPDIAETFTRVIKDLTNWALGVGKAEKNEPAHPQVSGSGMFWFIPNYPAVYQASIDSACGGSGDERTKTGEPYIVPPYSYSEGGANQLIAGADVLNIPALHLAFDRELLNEQYRDFHSKNDISTTSGGAAVLKQQIDYTAAAERAYRLRHATVVRCIMHHSIRREAHGHEVGVFQRTLMMVQDNLKASAPPGSSVAGGNPLGPSSGLEETENA